MLVVQMLLPRFLVLEGLIVVFQSFVPDKASACLSRAGEGTGNRVMDHSEGDVPSSQVRRYLAHANSPIIKKTRVLLKMV